MCIATDWTGLTLQTFGNAVSTACRTASQACPRFFLQSEMLRDWKLSCFVFELNRCGQISCRGGTIAALTSPKLGVCALQIFCRR
ncbi:hypothetical protein BC835DRAFT_1398040 [Cytidiella melzeri]|nr:hypothetical protein BC835DRAFT_1398040 [Cytidiella melzeri]